MNIFNDSQLRNSQTRLNIDLSKNKEKQLVIKFVYEYYLKNSDKVIFTCESVLILFETSMILLEKFEFHFYQEYLNNKGVEGNDSTFIHLKQLNFT